MSERHYRPHRAHARIALLNEHVAPNGQVYLSARTGSTTWTVSPIKNPLPNGPKWVLLVGENAHTSNAEAECGE
jgi:hypothetical protein